MISRMGVTAMLLGAGLLLSACANPNARIKRNQELFDSFPPDVQAQVRQGRIDIGYDTNMVFIALGAPDREYTRRSRDGVLHVWAYIDYYTQTRRQMVDGSFRVRDSKTGQIYQVRDSVWADVPTFYEYDRRRVEFEDGKVIAIEELTR